MPVRNQRVKFMGIMGWNQITRWSDHPIIRCRRAKITPIPLMSPEIEHLIALQHADAEIRRLRAEVAELPKRVAKIEEKLAGTKAGLEKARAAVKGDEAARRKYETAIT